MKKKKKARNKILRFFIKAALALVLGLVLFFYLVKWQVFGALPSKDELKDIKNATATLVLSSEGNLIGKIFDENRSNISFEDFPKNLVEALVATEDARFYEHDGVDNKSLLRVLVKSILLQDKSAGGGSTLSQQLAKNLYGRKHFGPLTMPVNKVKEMILAQRIETIYSKEQIIEHYLNTVSFSENVYGIKEAARRFFGKEVKRLNIEESAVLVGILKANTYYNPRLNPDNALRRRNVVINQMAVYGYLEQTQADSLRQLPLKLSYQNVERNAPAAYFLKHVEGKAKDLLKDIVKDDGASYDIQRDGLLIKTTLNTSMQTAAKAAMQKHLSKLQKNFDAHWKGSSPWRANPQLLTQNIEQSRSYKLLKKKGLSEDSVAYCLNKKHPVMVIKDGKEVVVEMSIRDSVAYYTQMLHAAFFAVNPQDGAVLAWVGGLDYDFLPYDHVFAKRQAASTFKPIVYATALEQGIDPCAYISNERRIYPEYDDWSPRNYDSNYDGLYSMKGALKHSVNVAAVQTLFDVGINNTIVTARRLGIESKLPNDPSIALGSASISLYEMVNAYGAFANGGYQVEPYMIEEIRTAEGELLYQRKDVGEKRRVISENTAAYITDMLQSVVNAGTAIKLRNVYGLKNPLAGKTGTAQNYTDGWFIGYNPKIVAGVWVGASSPQVHFRNGTYGSGSAMALPVFGTFFKTINRDKALYKTAFTPFKPLTDAQQRTLDCEDYREEMLLDKFKDLFGDDEGERIRERPKENGNKSSGFFKKIFGPKKKKK